jgi:hypothetical protein
MLRVPNRPTEVAADRVQLRRPRLPNGLVTRMVFAGRTACFHVALTLELWYFVDETNKATDLSTVKVCYEGVTLCVSELTKRPSLQEAPDEVLRMMLGRLVDTAHSEPDNRVVTPFARTCCRRGSNPSEKRG